MVPPDIDIKGAKEENELLEKLAGSVGAEGVKVPVPVIIAEAEGA